MADAGEYLSAFVAARVRGDSTELARITAAVADQTTADVPGIIPVPILGPVISLRQGLRPLWASLTSRPMPQYGATFNRPKVTQNTVVGTQTAEKAELLSQALKIEADSVAKVTVGGTLDVSFQSIDWTEPALMNVLVSDFADSYAWYTEQWLSAQFELSANGNAGQTADPADPAAVIAAFYNAAADVYAACFRYPDTVWASVDSWAALGSLVDGDGRPLFPNVSPSNAAGGTMGITSPSGSPLGARLVVSPFLTDGTIVVGSSAMYETYEKVRGLLQATNVTQLGMDLSYSGYVAQYCIEQAAFQPVHLTTPAVQSTSTKSTSTTSGS
jgi:HK97 family phage major capsid protein